MQILNQTRCVAEFTQGMDVRAREYLSLVIKGTFDFPADAGGTVTPADPRPLVTADEFRGEPGFSAPYWETDFAFRKRRCDVVLQGAAYAPGGQPAERVRTGIRVGGWQKMVDVVGAREWRVAGPVIQATRPYPFTRMEFSYDTAFGGVDRLDPDDPTPGAYAANPFGLGFGTVRNQSRLSGTVLPNTEEPGVEVTSPYGTFRPMAYGPIPRIFPDRLRYAGTYDQSWIDNVFPFLPADFDERYYHMAPEDQQIDPPQAGAEVILGNLTPEGRTAFRLPDTALPLTVFRGRETVWDARVLPDTLILDPEARQVMLAWRIAIPIRRTITEFTEAWIGPPSAAMLRARATGRAYIRAVATQADGVE